MSDVTNNSGIIPKGHRILIRPYELEQKTNSGIILATDSQHEREEMANTTGDVVGVGEGCNGWCAAGDRVIFAKYSGLLYTGMDGVRYRIINDDNVVGVLQGEVKIVDPYLQKGQ